MAMCFIFHRTRKFFYWLMVPPEQVVTGKYFILDTQNKGEDKAYAGNI